MGKFANFFKNIGEGIKKGATKVWDWGKNAVQKAGKVIRPIANVVSTVSGFLSNLPGKGGRIAKLLNQGAETVKTFTNMLPDSEAKTKINEFIDKGVDNGQNAINKATQYITRFNNKTQPWLNSSVAIANRLADASDRASGRDIFKKFEGYKGTQGPGGIAGYIPHIPKGLKPINLATWKGPIDNRKL